MDIHIIGVPPNARVTIQRVDREHGNVLPRWAAMGKPANPSPAQAEWLKWETALPPPERSALKDSVLRHALDQNALVLVMVEGAMSH